MAGLDRLAIRWTIGPVSEPGFEALHLSAWGAWRAFGAVPRVVCVNGLSVGEARERAGPLPPGLDWRDTTHEVPPHLAPVFGGGMAEGAAWKLVPLRCFPGAFELALDNDCILWDVPVALARWLDQPATGRACLLGEDVKPCYGQFAALAPDLSLNAGLRGVPPAFDLAREVAAVLAARARATGHPVRFEQGLDEQGLQVAALARGGALLVVALDDVAVCSPFWPHRPGLGRCGAHFVGLNAPTLPFDYYGRPADAWMREHWAKLAPQLRERTGAPGCRAAAQPA